MKISIEKKILLGFAIILAVLIALGIVSFYNTDKLINNYRMISHLHTVTNEIDDLRTSLIDSETGQRGFALTGQEIFLEPYQSAVTKINARLKNLRQMTADDREQQRRVASLEPLVAEQLAFIKENIALRRERGYEAARQSISTGRGKQIMDDIRRHLKEIEDEENLSMARRETEAEIYVLNTVITLSVLSLLVLALVPAGFYIIKRDFTRRKQAEAALEKESEFLSAVFENITDGIVACDADGRLTLFNRATREFHGLPVEPITAERWAEHFDLYLPDGETRMPTDQIPLFRALREGEVREAEMIIAPKNAVTRRLIANGQAIVGADGGNLGAVVGMRDITKRYEAEQSLRETLTLQRAIFDGASYMLISVGLDGTIKAFNRAAEKMTGYAAAVVVGRETPALFHDFEEISQYAQELSEELGQTVEPNSEFEYLTVKARAGVSFEREWTIVRKDGTRFPALLSITALRDTDGEVTGYLAVGSDITERKQAEEVFRREHNLSDFLENATVGLHWTAADGNIIWANKAELDMLGYSRDEYFGRNIAEFHDDKDTIADILKRENNDEVIQNYEARLRSKDGSIRHVLINSNVLWEDGEFIHTRCFTRDITERKETEEALRANEAGYRQLADAMPQIVWTARPDGFLDYYNQRWFDYTGMTLEQTIGWGWEPVLHPDDLRNCLDAWSKAVETGEKYKIEYRFKRAEDGEYRWHLGQALPVRDAENNIIKWFGTCTDIHEQKNVEEELRQIQEELELRVKSRTADLERSNAELQDFASVASHDLQEPLRKVQAFGDRLKAKCGDILNEAGRDYLERMQNAAGRMQTLINDLLSFSRVTIEAQPFVPVNLQSVANEALSDLETLIRTTNGTIEIGELATIEADPTQMRQLLQNLIGNALKFHRPEVSPIVKISGRMCNNLAPDNDETGAGAAYCLTVEDNGIGFDNKYIDRIFKVFQRLHGRSEYEGTGIGLAVCRRIAERHGGGITAQSSPGEGATFIVDLPVKQQEKIKNYGRVIS